MDLGRPVGARELDGEAAVIARQRVTGRNRKALAPDLLDKGGADRSTAEHGHMVDRPGLFRIVAMLGQLVQHPAVQHALVIVGCRIEEIEIDPPFGVRLRADREFIARKTLHRAFGGAFEPRAVGGVEIEIAIAGRGVAPGINRVATFRKSLVERVFQRKESLRLLLARQPVRPRLAHPDPEIGHGRVAGPWRRTGQRQVQEDARRLVVDPQRIGIPFIRHGVFLSLGQPKPASKDGRPVRDL